MAFLNFDETNRALPLYFESGITPLLLGHTGIGKTQLIRQYARTHRLDLIVLHVAQLEPADFVGLYKTTEDGRTMNCPPNWLPYLNAQSAEDTPVDKAKVEHVLGRPGVINPNGGIILLDEINRGHDDIRQALYQLILEGTLHTYSLPPTYKIVAAANPPQGYETYDFDPALINRFAWIKFRPDTHEPLDYLQKKFGVNPICSWLKSDTTLVDMGDDKFQVDGMRFTPRSVENALRIWTLLEKTSDREFQRKVLETLVVPERVASFFSFLKELEFCTWQDILQGNKKTEQAKLIKENRLDILSTVVSYLGDFFSKYEIGKTKSPLIPADKTDEYVKNVTDFLDTISPELCRVFIDFMDESMVNNPKLIIQNKYFQQKMGAKLGKFRHLFVASKK